MRVSDVISNVTKQNMNVMARFAFLLSKVERVDRGVGIPHFPPPLPPLPSPFSPTSLPLSPTPPPLPPLPSPKQTIPSPKSEFLISPTL